MELPLGRTALSIRGIIKIQFPHMNPVVAPNSCQGEDVSLVCVLVDSAVLVSLPV